METLKTNVIGMPTWRLFRGKGGKGRNKWKCLETVLDLDFNLSKQGLGGRKENMLEDSQPSAGPPAAWECVT